MTFDLLKIAILLQARVKLVRCSSHIVEPRKSVVRIKSLCLKLLPYLTVLITFLHLFIYATFKCLGRKMIECADALKSLIK